MPPAQTQVELEAEDAEVGVTSRTFRNHKGRTAMVVAVIGAVCAGVASIVVPISQSYLSRPAAKSNLEEVTKALKEASERQDKEIRQIHDDMLEQRAWFKGYLSANGIKVVDPPGLPSPSTQVIEITKPASSRRIGGSAGFGSGSGQVVVGTPLPSPKPLPKTKEIPAPFVPPPS